MSDKKILLKDEKLEPAEQKKDIVQEVYECAQRNIQRLSEIEAELTKLERRISFGISQTALMYFSVGVLASVIWMDLGLSPWVLRIIAWSVLAIYFIRAWRERRARKVS